MRRRPDCANGITEYLIARSALALGARGFHRLSLNFAAWGRLLDSAEDAGLAGRLQRLMAKGLNPFFQIQSLRDFNQKFGPEWVPRSVVIDDVSDLPDRAAVRQRGGVPRAAAAGDRAGAPDPAADGGQVAPTSRSVVPFASTATPRGAAGGGSNVIVLAKGATYEPTTAATGEPITPSSRSRPISLAERPSSSLRTSSLCSPSCGARRTGPRGTAEKSSGVPGIR